MPLLFRTIDAHVRRSRHVAVVSIAARARRAERRRGVLGARLRTRLVLAFVSLVLFPTVLLFLVAQGFLSAAMQKWFSYRVENAFDGSLEVAYTLTPFGERFMGILNEVRRLQEDVDRAVIEA